MMTNWYQLSLTLVWLQALYTSYGIGNTKSICTSYGIGNTKSICTSYGIGNTKVFVQVMELVIQKYSEKKKSGLVSQGGI